MANAATAGGVAHATKPELYSIFHNLSVAEQCFRYLLEAMDCDTDVDISIADARIDFDGLSRLCAVNIELASRLHTALTQQRGPDDHAPPMPAPRPGCVDNGTDLDKRFRESLVDLMVLAVQCWEQCTNKTRIDLAEQSRIWCVNIDEGRLRVRSMDRYLGINKLPKNPRWRDVIKTAYFVLETVEGDGIMIQRLQETLEHTLSIIRRRAL